MPECQFASPAPSARALVAAGVSITGVLLVGIHALTLDGSTHGLSPIFFTLFVQQDRSALQCTLLILLLAALLPGGRAGVPLLQWIGRNPLTVAGSGTILLGCGAWVVYRRLPLSMDEYSAVFQSQVFAAGHLAGRFPQDLLDWLIPRGFQDYFLNVARDTGQVTSVYWPSFALALAPFSWLGMPWLCNPVVSGLTLLAVQRLARRVFGDDESAGLAVLLTAASPVFFGDGISYYSMPADLLANTLYALCLLAPTPRRALTAGVVGSVALTLHDPVPHMLFALPWMVALVRRPDGVRICGALLLGYLPLCLVLGVGWFWFTQPEAGLAHVGAAFAFPTSTLLLARAVGIAKLWAWAVPGLPVLAGIGAWHGRTERTCRLLTASAALTLLGYLFVPFDQGHGWGFRYFHSAWVALPVLATAAWRPRRDEGAAARTRRPVRVLEFAPARTFIVHCALLSLLLGTGLRALQIRDFVTRHLSQMPAYAGTEHRVIILDTRNDFYGRDLVQNHPWLHGDRIVMITHGAQADAAMMRARFPGMCRVYVDRFGSVWSAAAGAGTCAELGRDKMIPPHPAERQ